MDINAFNQPLDQWDVSSVTTINSMFTVNSGQFNQDISMWDVSNIISAGDPEGLQGYGNNNPSHSSDLFTSNDPLYFTILQS